MTRPNAAVVAALSAQLAVSAVQQGLPTIAPALQAELRIDMPAVGVLLGAVNAAGAVTVWAWGGGADRFGDRRMLLVGLPVAAMALTGAAAAVAARSPAAVACALAAAGAGVAAGTAALAKALTQQVAPARWGLVLGARQAAVPAGALLAAALLAPITTTVNVGAAMLALAVLVTMATLTIAWGLSTATPRSKPDAMPIPVSGRRRLPGLGLLLIGNGCYCVAQTATMAWAVTAWHSTAGLDTATAANLFAATQAVSIVVRLALGRLGDARPGSDVPILIGAGVCTMALLGALAGAHRLEAPTAVVAGVLAGATVAAGSWNGTAFATSTRLANSAAAGHRLGRVHGLQNTVLFAAVGLTPPVAATVITHTGWAVTWAALAVTAAVGVAAHVQLHRRLLPTRSPATPADPRIPSARSTPCASSAPTISC
ncbi:MFS transporter [Micromonospora aurantiaca (nom. illeg.)]|uniref:MFS transporter n=1 Tax=Micromonospora aurantiaca (nom. illeg.) TaxID=47850 RepID=UPI0037AE3E64